MRFEIDLAPENYELFVVSSHGKRMPITRFRWPMGPIHRLQGPVLVSDVAKLCGFLAAQAFHLAEAGFARAQDDARASRAMSAALRLHSALTRSQKPEL